MKCVAGQTNQMNCFHFFYSKKYYARSLFLGVVIVSLITNIEWTITELRKIITGRKDEVATYVHKINSIKVHLPNIDIIGYTFKHGGVKETNNDFYLTQYGLAPTIVSRSDQEDYVLLSYDTDDDLYRFCKKNNCHVLNNLGSGFAILKKNDPVN
jgi:hypothetical protein